MAPILGQGPRTGGKPEARSFDGKKLYPQPLSASTKQRYDSLLAIAKANYAADPNNLDNIIWLGRRTAYLNRYQEAIRIFSDGLQRFPNSPELYRHRGHRYLTTRQLDKAIADFQKAADLAKHRPIEIEPDGLPNRINVPLSNLHFNIYYHWALAHYLKGDFRQAAILYEECLQYSNNDDLYTAAADWLYMSYRRTGETHKAEHVLLTINPEMNIIENDAYFQRLLMYKGQKQASDLLNLDSRDPDALLNLVTQGYGVGNWYLYNGDPARAREIFRKILDTNYWAAFGYIAAEAELSSKLEARRSK